MNQLVDALAYWRNNPVDAVKDWFGVTPEPYQADMLNELFLGSNKTKISRLAAKSGHGVGKTSFASWCVAYYLITRPHCRIPCTAPTHHQLKDILWPEISKWMLKLPEQLRQQWLLTTSHIRHKKFDRTWFAVARTSNKAVNLQGFHNDNVLVVCEEASGIPQDVYTVIEGILSNAEQKDQEAILLLVGNPTEIGGEFYNAFHRNKAIYSRFTISGDEQPPADPNGGRIYVSKRVTSTYRNNMAVKYGRDSAVYDVRVRGLFPREADDVVIPFSWAARACSYQLPPFDKIAHPIRLVMDVARFGGDETVLGVFRGLHCIEMKTWPKTSTVECVNILKDAFDNPKYQGRVTQVIIDEPGVGGGVIDMARLESLPVVPYNGGATMKTDVDSYEDIRMFANRRSRDWWFARRMFEMNNIHIPDDEILVNQLASVKFGYFNEKIKVETKKEMRERLGEDASPDRADVIIMGIAPFQSFESALPSAALDPNLEIIYGEDRPTSYMDF